MTLSIILNIAFLVSCAITLLFLILCGLAWRSKRARRVWVFVGAALFFFLAAFPLIYFGLKEGDYEFAVHLVNSETPRAYEHFDRLGDYRDSKNAAELLKAIIEPTDDFPGLVRKASNYSGSKKTLSDSLRARLLLRKITDPANFLAFLSAWPMDLITANKFALEDVDIFVYHGFGVDHPAVRLSLRVDDPEGRWLQNVSDSASEKVVIYYTNDRKKDRSVCFGCMNMLPAKYLPGPADAIGRVILLHSKSRITGSYVDGTPAGVLATEVTICSLPDLRVLKHIGTADGGPPPRRSATRQGVVVYGPGPKDEDIIKLITKAVNELDD